MSNYVVEAYHTPPVALSEDDLREIDYIFSARSGRSFARQHRELRYDESPGVARKWALRMSSLLTDSNSR